MSVTGRWPVVATATAKRAMNGEAVEIITGHERYRHWNVAEKLRIVAESEAREVRGRMPLRAVGLIRADL
jgi:hypothetical protein